MQIGTTVIHKKDETKARGLDTKSGKKLRQEELARQIRHLIANSGNDPRTLKSRLVFVAKKT